MRAETGGTRTAPAAVGVVRGGADLADPAHVEGPWALAGSTGAAVVPSFTTEPVAPDLQAWAWTAGAEPPTVLGDRP